MEPGRTKHRRRYSEPVPEDVEQDGPEAVAKWRQGKAREWDKEQERRVRIIRAAKERRRSLMQLSPDARMLTCSMLPPLDMYMLYESNLGEPADEVGDDFRGWCNRTTIFGEEAPNIWDKLLEKHYPQAGARNPTMTGDQRRWCLYAWVIQAVPNGDDQMYVFDFPPDGDWKKAVNVTVTRLGNIELSVARAWKTLPGEQHDQELLTRIAEHNLKVNTLPLRAGKVYAIRQSIFSTGRQPDLANIFYEILVGGWVYEIEYKEESVIIACSACGSPNVRYACGTCAAYTFCSHECSNALAKEHYELCSLLDAPDYVGASLATWEGYTPRQLVDKTQDFLKKFAGGPSTGAQAKLWVLKQVYRQELKNILTALNNKLKAGQAPQTQSQLEVMKQRVMVYVAQGD